jgi:hypothetical protein
MADPPLEVRLFEALNHFMAVKTRSKVALDGFSIDQDSNR